MIIAFLPLISGLTFGILLQWRIVLSLRRRKTIRGIYFRRVLLADQLIDLVTLAGMAIITYSVSLIDFGLGHADMLQTTYMVWIIGTAFLAWNELWRMRRSRHNKYKDEYSVESREIDTLTSFIANRSGLACGLACTMAMAYLRLSAQVPQAILFGLPFAPLYLLLSVLKHHSRVALSNMRAKRKGISYPDTTRAPSSSPE